MRSKLCICSTLLLAVSGIGLASAQVCSGEFSFAGSPAHAFVGIGFNRAAETYHAGLRVGGARTFGQAEFGMATYDAGGDAWDYGLGLGLQLGDPEETKAHLCPEIFVGIARGPKDVGSTGINYSETHFAIGADAGFVWFHGKGIDIAPSASFAIASAWYRLTAPTVADSTGADTWGIVALGVGFGFDNQVMLSPSIGFPVGLPGAGTAYGVSFSIKLRNGR